MKDYNVDEILATRDAGYRLIQGANNFHDIASHQAGTNEKHLFDVYRKMLIENPDALTRIKGYIIDRGEVPANDIDEALCQFAVLRSKHIADKVKHYDNIVGSIASRAPRSEGALYAMQKATMPVDSAGRIQAGTLDQIENPSVNEAQAEIIGEESQDWDSEDHFTGYEDSYDNHLNYITAASYCGNAALNSYKGYDCIDEEQKGAISDILAAIQGSGIPDSVKKLLNIKGKKTDAGDIAKATIDKIKTHEVKGFLHDNAGTLVIGILLLIGIGFILKK